MKKIIFLASLCMFCILVMSNKGGRAKVGGEGMTGAPGDKTLAGQPQFCNFCHDASAYDISGAIKMYDQNNQIQTKFKGGQTYKVVFKPSSTGTTPKGYGFQIMAMIDNGSKPTNSFSTPSADGQVTTLNNRQYFEHNKLSTKDSFTINWTAPASGSGDVSFYLSMVGGNNNNDNTGDGVFNKVFKIGESTIGNFSIKTKTLKIYPNPVANFLYFDQAYQHIEIYNLSGDLILNSSDDISKIDLTNIPPGMYLIRGLQADRNTQKVNSFIKL